MAIIRGAEKLERVHPHLERLIRRAALEIDFVITEGARTLERQRKLVAQGASRTLKSRHLVGGNGYAHAVDIYPVVNGQTIANWEGGSPAADRKRNGAWTRLSGAVKRAAKAVGVPVEWGGDWKTFVDGPHWQLPWDSYPAGKLPAELAREPEYRKHGLVAVNPKPLAQSRTVWGGAAALAGGVATMAKETQTALEAASGHLSAGTVIGLAIGALIIIGAAAALYARWRDGGSPMPGDEPTLAPRATPEDT